jgi:hypothetical protein
MNEEIGDQGEKFGVHQVAALAAAKWSTDVFKHFIRHRLFVAPCNNYF